MTDLADRGLAALSDPALAALLCAVDPFGLGGIAVRSRAGPLRDRWLAMLRGALPPEAPLRRLPLHADDHRVFGGLDLTATLAAGRPVAERGVIAEADGGVLVLSMAERLSGAMAARLGAVLDSGRVEVAAQGSTRGFAAQVGIVALDEGIEPDERPPAALLDRLAFWVDLDGFDPAEVAAEAAAVAFARQHCRGVAADDAVVRALCETAEALGVWSLRAPILALRAAQALAGVSGRTVVDEADAARAARLVLAPRATRLPLPRDDTPAERDPAPREREEGGDPPSDADNNTGESPEPPEDLVLAAAKAAIPAGLLARLIAGTSARSGQQAQGRAGALQASMRRGRPAGLRAGKPGGGARLDIAATLRAAAPWQKLRTLPSAPSPALQQRRIAVRGADLRITRFKQRSETTTIFVVDASGSLALNRLAEVKGAIELLLAECYVRRDHVALLAFRGRGAELLLPPTRSLARAKRSLADLPGGGATPLATAIDAATALALAVRRRGQTPVVVFLTDGRGNVARDGSTGREQAAADASLAARAAADTGVRMLVVDASPRPQPAAKAFADSMRASHIALPSAQAGALSRAVLEATAG